MDPTGFIRAAVISHHDLVADLLAAETEAARHTERESDDYYTRIEELAGPLARKQMTSAARDVLRFWYTAWVAAGEKPVARIFSSITRRCTRWMMRDPGRKPWRSGMIGSSGSARTPGQRPTVGREPV